MNLGCEVMVRPATIAHVTDLDLNIIADSRSAFKLFLALACVLGAFALRLCGSSCLLVLFLGVVVGEEPVKDILRLSNSLN